MTTQFESGLKYKDESYGIFATANDNCDDLFSPSDFGLSPYSTCTASYRGWCANFGVSESQLVLHDLYVNLKEAEGPVLNGVPPIEKKHVFNNHYYGINLPLSFTGGVLLSRKPHGYLTFKLWHFSTVLELVFDGGKLVNEFDRSSVVAHLRKTIEDGFTREYVM